MLPLYRVPEIYHLLSEFLCQVDEHCEGKGIFIKEINECDCNPGWFSADCTGMYCYIIQGPLKISSKLTNGCFFYPTDFECTNDEHCNFNGECNNGKCDCNPGWLEADCSGE